MKFPEQQIHEQIQVLPTAMYVHFDTFSQEMPEPVDVEGVVEVNEDRRFIPPAQWDAQVGDG